MKTFLILEIGLEKSKGTKNIANVKYSFILFMRPLWRSKGMFWKFHMYNNDVFHPYMSLVCLHICVGNTKDRPVIWNDIIKDDILVNQILS